MSKPKTETF